MLPSTNVKHLCFVATLAPAQTTAGAGFHCTAGGVTVPLLLATSTTGLANRLPPKKPARFALRVTAELLVRPTTACLDAVQESPAVKVATDSPR